MRSPHTDATGGDADCFILLMTLKTGGVGLNLTSANHVLMLDPWWYADWLARAHWCAWLSFSQPFYLFFFPWGTM
jgi:hypothetical protein